MPNAFLQSVLDADLATIPAADPARPVAPVGYGTDLVCVTDVTDTLDEVDSQSPAAIAQAIVRRLITPRGGLIDDAEYGYDLRAFVNQGVTQAELARITDSVRSEARKDDRVSDARVTVNYDGARNALGIECAITPVNINTGTFAFTFSVTASGALIESIR